MSLKTIELQIAIPRTLEAGKIQEQILNQGKQQIQNAADARHTDAEKQVKTVHPQDPKDQAKWHDQLSEKGRHSEYEKEQHSKHEVTDGPAEKQSTIEGCCHPYKGKRIDFSG